MSKSNQITELNQRSLKLTDAELAMVEKFSVLLPMNELPEIVIANQKQAQSSSAKKTVRSVPENAIIPFQKEKATPEQAPDESTNSAENPKNKENQGKSLPSDSEKEIRVEPSLQEVTVEFPRDELSISGRPESSETEQEHASETEEAIFDIAEHGKYHDRVEAIAESIVSGLNPNQPSAYVLVSPANSPDLELIFNSLLLSIANRSHDRKLIGIQGVWPQMDDSSCSVGLGHVLSDEYLLEDVVVPTSSDNLDYLAFSDSSLSNNSYKNRINRMLGELKKHYDLVFLNAGVATSPEALALAEAADAFYMLIRQTDAEQDPVVQAVKALRNKGARLAGCILSGFQREAS